jgi:RimJ/RimL family protein N-acetyltransferase
MRTRLDRLIVPARIATPRLLLEPVAVGLARAVVAGDLSAVLAGERWPHDDTVDGLNMALEHGHAPGWFVMLDDLVIGDCGTHGDPDAAGTVELGFGLSVAYRGQGYGTEVAGGLAHWLLAQSGVSRVIGRVQHENLPSRRALEHAGFAIESSDEWHVSYALSRTPR